MRRGSIASLLGIGIVAGGIAAAVALALPWLPRPASDEAGRIDPLFWFVIVICIVVFAVVVAVMLYSIVRFRAAPDDDSDGPPVHGHTGLEIVWTLIPTVLVTAIGIYSAIVSGACARSALTTCVAIFSASQLPIAIDIRPESSRLAQRMSLTIRASRSASLATTSSSPSRCDSSRRTSSRLSVSAAP